MRPPDHSRRRQREVQTILPSPNVRPLTLDIADTVRRAHDTWLAFLEFIDRHSHTRWIFRGCGSLTYGCLPSAGRVSNYDPLNEIRVFRAFQRSAGLFVETSQTSDWEWLALAQHHGLPTRLLDWTTNPLVACFFAVASGPLKEDAIIYAYSLQDEDIIDPASQPDPFKIERVSFLMPAKTTLRIVSQRGLFSVHHQPNLPWAPDEFNSHHFVIPGPLRARFRHRLFRLGIDPGHIWADLDGLCETLKWRYEARIGVSATMVG
jgi:FRG domain